MASPRKPCGRPTQAGGTCGKPDQDDRGGCYLHRSARVMPDSESDDDVPGFGNLSLGRDGNSGEWFREPVPDRDFAHRVCVILAPGLTEGESSDLAGVKEDGLAVGNKFKKVFRFRDSGNGVTVPESKDRVMHSIFRFFTKERPDQTEYYWLFYSGHGYENGDWSVERGRESGAIAPKEVFDLWKRSEAYKNGARLVLVVDSCYSGVWVQQAKKLKVPNLAIQSSCSDQEGSDDVTSFANGFMAHDFRKFVYKVGREVKSPMAYVSWMKPANTYTIQLGESKTAQFWTA